jgi:hypothetical protein
VSRLPQLLKEPLIQFLLIGACIYGTYALFGAPDEENADSTILVDANRINGFVAQWKSRWNRPPTRQELDGVINGYVHEEILYRQAVSMGLDQDDVVTRRRMASKLEFLTNDLVRLAEPAEGELETYFQDNIAQYVAPDLFTFIQVFFDPDKRDETTLDDASQELARLQEAGVPDPEALQAGDRLMLRSYYQSASELDIRKQLGGGFASAVIELEPATWHGPILSGYGVHLVYIYERLEAPPPVLAEVRPRVLEAWQAGQMKTFNAEFYESLKSRYEVVIEDPELGPDSLLQIDQGMADDGAAEAEPAS